MSAVFACPHCGIWYPLKPVLIDKSVRCKSCQGVFRLRDDGVIDKLEAPPDLPETDPQPGTRAIATSAPASTPRAVLAVEATSGARVPPDAPSATATFAGSRAANLTKQQEEARKAMAGMLSTAAAALLKSDAVKPEPAGIRKAAPRAVKSSANSVLVVGEGATEFRYRRLWMGAGLAICLAIALSIALCSLSSPQRRALEAFAAPAPEQFARYPLRLPHLQSRAWLTNTRALIDIGSVRFGRIVRYELVGVKPLIAETLKERTYLPKRDLWARTSDLFKIDKGWSDKRDRAANIKALNADEPMVLTRESLESQLQAAGLSAPGTTLLLRLLLPGPGVAQGDARRISDGDLPDAIEVSTFNGRKGVSLQNVGIQFIYPVGDYSGSLLRFIGPGWSTEWRVLEVDFAP